RQRALTSAEMCGLANALTERPRQHRYHNIGSRIERHRCHSQHHKLQKHIATASIDELRDKREKEQCSLRIQHLGHHALPEGIPPGGEFDDAGAGVLPGVENHSDAEKTKISSA